MKTDLFCILYIGRDPFLDCLVRIKFTYKTNKMEKACTDFAYAEKNMALKWQRK